MLQLIENHQVDLAVDFILKCIDRDEEQFLRLTFKESQYQKDYEFLIDLIANLINCTDDPELVKKMISAAIELEISLNDIEDRWCDGVESADELFEYHQMKEDIQTPDYLEVDYAATGRNLIEHGHYVTARGVYFEA